MKYIVKVRNDSGYFQDGQDRYIGLENVESNGGGYVATSTEYASNKYAVCLKGDLLYSKLRPYLAKCIVSPFDGFCTNEFIVMKEFKCNREYLRYWLTSPKMTEEIDASTYGAKMPRASEGFILGTKILLPPLPEQHAIAAFLDSVTAKIDVLRVKIKREIERLDCYKKSAITDAVCRGLDPKVKMKDSGIPWVGQVPEGWKVSRLGFEARKLTRSFSEEDKPLICSNKGNVTYRTEATLGQVSSRLDGFQGVKSGDLLIHGMDTWHGAIAVSNVDGKCTTVVHVCETPNSDKRYVSYQLRAFAFLRVYKAFSNGVRQNTSDFRSWAIASRIPLVIPEINEQHNIADFLDAMVARVDGMVAKRKQQLDALDKLKRTVVYDYVTGKKEVPR